MPERTFARLVSEGLPRVGAGHSTKFPWPNIWYWYVDREKAKAKETAKPLDLTMAEAERREKMARAELAEMKRDQQRGLLVERRIYEAEFRAMTGRLRGAILALRGRHTRTIIGLANEHQGAAAMARISEELLGEMQRAGDEEDEADEEEPAA